MSIGLHPSVPGATTAKGKRDVAILAVLLCAGLRRTEAAALTQSMFNSAKEDGHCRFDRQTCSRRNIIAVSGEVLEDGECTEHVGAAVTEPFSRHVPYD
jgi:hypothetical protein